MEENQPVPEVTPTITVPEPQTKDEWYEQISKGLRKQDGV